MAKNNFKAKEATSDANYAQSIGTLGQGAMSSGIAQQGEGFNALRDTLGQQKSFADMLQEAAAGRGGPTMAEQQIKDATARNNANAAGFAAGAKSLNPALAARQALMAQAGNNQTAAGQAAQTRVQEQLAAREQLGGALAGEAGTAGGMTSAGQGMTGTGGSLANQSNANLVSSRQGANQINADVAKQNAGVMNGLIGGLASAAGGVMTGGATKMLGLAEGGVVPGEPEGTQNDETSIALAKGGLVPAAGRLPTGIPHVQGAMPHRSFAAQVAHHLSREYFAEGGEAHGSYDFPAMDLRHVKPHPKPKTESGADTTMFIPHDYHPSQTPTESKEGTDSEGKPKPSINRAFGGPADAQEFYDETDDDPDADNEPDTDQATDPDEAEEHYYAEGGVADESAGLDMSHKALDAAEAAKRTPSMFGTVLGSLGNGMSQAGSALQEGSSMQPNFGPKPAGQNSYRDLVKAGGIPLPPGMTPGTSPADPRLQNATGRMHKSGGPLLKTTIPVREPVMAAGGPVPGQARVPGNSLKNDVVDAKLSPGEVVLPRTIAHDPEKAKKFVEHLMTHGGSGHSALKAIKGKK